MAGSYGSTASISTCHRPTVLPFATRPSAQWPTPTGATHVPLQPVLGAITIRAVSSRSTPLLIKVGVESSLRTFSQFTPQMGLKLVPWSPSLTSSSPVPRLTCCKEISLRVFKGWQASAGPKLRYQLNSSPTSASTRSLHYVFHPRRRQTV